MRRAFAILIKRYFTRWQDLAWIGFLPIALLAAAGATLAISNAPVEIAIDFEAPAEGAALRWPEGRQALEALDTAYAPHYYRVSVTAPGGDAHNGGFQLIVMAGIGGLSFSDASQWAHLSTYFMLVGPERPEVLALEGWSIGPNPYLSFESDLMSEPVIVQSGGGPPQTLNLQSKQRGKVVYPIQTEQRLHRYLATVPRHALRHLVIETGNGARPPLHRLYVNSLVPRIYYGGEAPPNRPAGIIQANWAPAWEGGAFALPGAYYLGAHMLFTFLSFLALSIAVPLVTGFVLIHVFRAFRASWRRTGQDELPGVQPGIRLVASFWAPAFLAWFVFLVAFYPGTMNSDALIQWAESRTFVFTPQHPPVYALIMRAAAWVWDSPFSTALLQVAAGSGVVALAFALLWSAGAHRGVILALYALTVLSPRNNTSIIALLKDTPYAIALLGMAVFLAWICLRPGRTNGRLWACAGLCMGLATVFRHNGPLVAAAMLPLLLFYFPRDWRGWLASTVITALIFIAITRVLYGAITIERGDGGLHDLTTSHLAILLDRDVPLHGEEYAFLEKVRDLEDRWAYHPRRADSTAVPFLHCYHRGWAREHGAPYFHLYRRIVARNILNASLYFIERGEFLYVPWERNEYMEKYFLGISTNTMGLFGFDLFLELPGHLRAALAWTSGPRLSGLFWRPALPLYLVLAACITLCIRRRSISWSIVYLPFFINTATIALAAISQAARYQYPLALASGFLIALAFLPARSGGNDPKTEAR